MGLNLFFALSICFGLYFTVLCYFSFYLSLTHSLTRRICCICLYVYFALNPAIDRKLLETVCNLSIYLSVSICTLWIERYPLNEKWKNKMINDMYLWPSLASWLCVLVFFHFFSIIFQIEIFIQYFYPIDMYVGMYVVVIFFLIFVIFGFGSSSSKLNGFWWWSKMTRERWMCVDVCFFIFHFFFFTVLSSIVCLFVRSYVCVVYA